MSHPAIHASRRTEQLIWIYHGLHLPRELARILERRIAKTSLFCQISPVVGQAHANQLVNYQKGRNLSGRGSDPPRLYPY